MGETWVQGVPASFAPRIYHAAVGTGGSYVVLGGRSTGSTDLNDVLLSSDKGLSWYSYALAP